jgi:hypothetical protein
MGGFEEKLRKLRESKLTFAARLLQENRKEKV